MDESDKKPDKSPGGDKIFRYAERSEQPLFPPAEIVSVEKITSHIETHLGNPATVFNEIVSQIVHIDVHIVLPNPKSQFVRLVTSGMSDLPMHVPAKVDSPKFLELMITLPTYWKLDTDFMLDPNWYWPVRLIKSLARFPHAYQTWLGDKHTVPNGDPPAPYAAGTKLCCALLEVSQTAPPQFETLTIGSDRKINFLAVVPLYPNEVRYKLEFGAEAMQKKLRQSGITDLIDPSRPNALERPKKFWLF